MTTQATSEPGADRADRLTVAVIGLPRPQWRLLAAVFDIPAVAAVANPIVPLIIVDADHDEIVVHPAGGGPEHWPLSELAIWADRNALASNDRAALDIDGEPVPRPVTVRLRHPLLRAINVAAPRDMPAADRRSAFDRVVFATDVSEPDHDAVALLDECGPRAVVAIDLAGGSEAARRDAGATPNGRSRAVWRYDSTWVDAAALPELRQQRRHRSGVPELIAAIIDAAHHETVDQGHTAEREEPPAQTAIRRPVATPGARRALSPDLAAVAAALPVALGTVRRTVLREIDTEMRRLRAELDAVAHAGGRAEPIGDQIDHHARQAATHYAAQVVALAGAAIREITGPSLAFYVIGQPGVPAAGSEIVALELRAGLLLERAAFDAASLVHGGLAASSGSIVGQRLGHAVVGASAATTVVAAPIAVISAGLFVGLNIALRRRAAGQAATRLWLRDRLDLLHRDLVDGVDARIADISAGALGALRRHRQPAGQR